MQEVCRLLPPQNLHPGTGNRSLRRHSSACIYILDKFLKSLIADLNESKDGAERECRWTETTSVRSLANCQSRTAFPSSLRHRSPSIGCKQQQQSLNVRNSSVIQTVVCCFIFLNSEEDMMGLRPSGCWMSNSHLQTPQLSSSAPCGI